jgi:hypothetical protein
MRLLFARRFSKLIGIFAFILTFLFGVIGMVVNTTFPAEFSIDTSAPGKVIGNKVSNINLWSLNGLLGTIDINETADANRFTEYMQIMTATGGNADRDLFVNPNDRTVLDDYDFSSLLQACHKIIQDQNNQL